MQFLVFFCIISAIQSLKAFAIWTCSCDRTFENDVEGGARLQDSNFTKKSIGKK